MKAHRCPPVPLDNCISDVICPMLEKERCICCPHVLGGIKFWPDAGISSICSCIGVRGGVREGDGNCLQNGSKMAAGAIGMVGDDLQGIYWGGQGLVLPLIEETKKWAGRINNVLELKGQERLPEEGWHGRRLGVTFYRGFGVSKRSS